MNRRLTAKEVRFAEGQAAAFRSATGNPLLLPATLYLLLKNAGADMKDMAKVDMTAVAKPQTVRVWR